MTLTPEEKENRDCFEKWCDRHNHKMALGRTVFGLIILLLQLYILVTRLPW